MLDRSLRLTIAHLPTLFLVCALPLVIIHTIAAFMLRDVIGLSDLFPQLRALQGPRQVLGVGAADVGRFWLIQGGLALFALLSVPLVAKAARGALAGRSVTRAWTLRHPSGGSLPPPVALTAPGWAGAVAAALLVASLTELVALASLDLVPRDLRWGFFALSQATAWSLGMSFLVLPQALKEKLLRRRTSNYGE